MKKRIAICGTRGVPASYGGFETFAEELGKRLVERGYDVTVFCRRYANDSNVSREYTYKGIHCISLKAIKHKYFETPLHTLASFVQKEIKDVDLVLLCNAANSPFAFIPRLRGKPVVINVDGIERERRKWNMVGKVWYHFGELCSVLFGTKLISDADYIQDYYKKKYFRKSTVIRYGAREISPALLEAKIANSFSDIYEKHKSFYDNFNITPGNYILYVSRLEPENNADKVILAYNLLPAELRESFDLVIVGDAPYANDFKNSLLELGKKNNVKFLGYQFGESYENLQSGAYVYVQATEVGGTHPALVEAMGFANAILANDVVEHREVIDGVAELYKYNNYNDLSRLLSSLILDVERVRALRRKAFVRAHEEYSWDSVVEKYDELFKEFI